MQCLCRRVPRDTVYKWAYSYRVLQLLDRSDYWSEKLSTQYELIPLQTVKYRRLFRLRSDEIKYTVVCFVTHERLQLKIVKTDYRTSVR